MANIPFFNNYSNYYNYYQPRNYSNFKKNYNNIDNSNNITLDSFDRKNDKNEKKEDCPQFSQNEKKSSKYNSFGPFHFSNPLFSDLEEPIVEILGIKLYLDDIIILGLLFFLYKENVQDELLFLSLILLLLS